MSNIEIIAAYPVISRTPENADLDKIQGVSGHEPRWFDVDGPEMAGPHLPDVLACKECEDDWPCGPAQAVIEELERIAKALDPSTTGVYREVADMLLSRARQLRGER